MADLAKYARRVDHEHLIQSSLATALRLLLGPDVAWFAVPNGGQRHKAVAGKMKAEGAQSGVADLIFLHAGRALAMEMKTPSGRLSTGQADWRESWERAGGEYVVCRGVLDALQRLNDWGAPFPSDAGYRLATQLDSQIAAAVRTHHTIKTQAAGERSTKEKGRRT